MAITLNPQKNYKEGVIRCIKNRKGKISIKGYIDKSELFVIKGDLVKNFNIIKKLIIKGEKQIINKLLSKDYIFLGLEDPDIWVDNKKKLLHLFFTIPFVSIKKHYKNKIFLGHAQGKSLSSLQMKNPVLKPDKIGGAKELSIAPINKKGVRYNLVESSKKEKDFNYSVIRLAITKDICKQWKLGNIVFHPKKHKIPWVAGHASPGPLLPKNFLNIGERKLLGIMNGREANQKTKDGRTKYNMFSIGLFIYDYENGNIKWVSPEPLIQDTEAKSVTFASQFVLTRKGEGILFAHVDDSFIRAYTLKAHLIESFISRFSHN